jgi:hypothetical protein
MHTDDVARTGPFKTIKNETALTSIEVWISVEQHELIDKWGVLDRSSCDTCFLVIFPNVF